MILQKIYQYSKVKKHCHTRRTVWTSAPLIQHCQPGFESRRKEAFLTVHPSKRARALANRDQHTQTQPSRAISMTSGWNLLSFSGADFSTSLTFRCLRFIYFFSAYYISDVCAGMGANQTRGRDFCFVICALFLAMFVIDDRFGRHKARNYWVSVTTRTHTRVYWQTTPNYADWGAFLYFDFWPTFLQRALCIPYILLVQQRKAYKSADLWKVDLNVINLASLYLNWPFFSLLRNTMSTDTVTVVRVNGTVSKLD